MSSGWQAAATAGTGVAGPLIGGLFNRQGQIEANNANAAAAAKQMEFQNQQSSTQWRRGVDDMRAAGLNPALAYSQGPASAMSGSSYQAENALAPLGDSIAQGISSASDLVRLQREGVLQNSTIAMNAASANQANSNAVLLNQLAENAGFDASGKKAEAELWDSIGGVGKAVGGIAKHIPMGPLLQKGAGNFIKLVPKLFK